MHDLVLTATWFPGFVGPCFKGIDEFLAVVAYLYLLYFCIVLFMYIYSYLLIV